MHRRWDRMRVTLRRAHRADAAGVAAGSDRRCRHATARAGSQDVPSARRALVDGHQPARLPSRHRRVATRPSHALADLVGGHLDAPVVRHSVGAVEVDRGAAARRLRSLLAAAIRARRRDARAATLMRRASWRRAAGRSGPAGCAATSSSVGRWGCAPTGASRGDRPQTQTGTSGGQMQPRRSAATNRFTMRSSSEW